MSGMGFSQSVPSYVPTNGLVGWWGFNGNAQDNSGNGNHGTVNGATLTTDRFGNQNGAYDFDGINDRIRIPHSSNFLNDTGSISLWMNASQLPSLNDNQDCLFGKGWGYPQLLFRNDGKVYIQVTNTNPSSSFVSIGMQNTIQTNQWRHIVATYEGPKLSLYVNGVLNNSQVVSLSPGYVAFCNSEFWMGGFRHLNSCMPNDSVQFFKGRIDDAGFWNRALTPQEITNLYNSQLPTQTSLCLPTITTTSPSSVGVDTVVIGGDISNDGGSYIVLRGVCYSTSPNPNMGNQRTEDGSGTGSFNTVLRDLTSSTTYYARSYAKNSNGVVVYGNEVSFTTSASLPGVRCPGTPTVTDIDGNIYNTVQIGNQCWTQSNLRTSKYRNGDSIQTGLSNSQWSSTSSGAYAIYNNDPVNDGLYGKLYNHYAVTDSRGLCPTGWHVPSDTDWTILGNQFGGSALAGSALKSTLSQPNPGGWPLPNSSASNSSGFTAIPGGLIGNNGLYYSGNSDGYWWTTTFGYLWGGLSRVILENGTGLLPNHTYNSFGMSVRCLKNTLPQVNTTSVTNVTPSFALVTGEVISEGDQNTTRGFCYSTTSNPTITNNTTVCGTGLGVYSDTLQNLTPLTTYYFRAYATNSFGTSYGTELSFTTDSLPGLRCPGTPTVTDIDGNVYYTVQIGNQCWTQSNLKVSKYRNGDNIPTGLSNYDWQNTTSGAYAIYNNDLVNDGLLGKLYNHYAITDIKGLCPTGWHVPSDGEWTTLENHLGGSSVAGGALKSTVTLPTPGGWNPPNTGATNSSGFTALPGGFRNNLGELHSMSYYGHWWSSSTPFGPGAWYCSLHYDNSLINRSLILRAFGSSVRCLKD